MIDFTNKILNRARALARQKANRVRRRAQELLTSYVPIDQEGLKQACKAEIYETSEGFEIRLFVQDTNLQYDNKPSIKAKKLAMILAIGKGRSGVTLKRSKTNSEAAKGEPTKEWFSKALAHLEREFYAI